MHKKHPKSWIYFVQDWGAYQLALFVYQDLIRVCCNVIQ